MLETLNAISVPKAPQGNTFTHHVNRQRNDDVGSWGKKSQTHQVVRGTNGSELGHYYKLGIINM